MFNHYLLCLGSEDTVNFFLPLALLLANTFLPFAVAMRSLKPCLFLLFRTDGWNVLFIFEPLNKNQCYIILQTLAAKFWAQIYEEFLHCQMEI